MKYFVASLAFIGVIFIYAVIAASVGWSHGGGYLVMGVVILGDFRLWRYIVAKMSDTQDSNIVEKTSDSSQGNKTAAPKPPPVKKAPPVPFAGFQDLPTTQKKKSSKDVRRLTDGKD